MDGLGSNVSGSYRTARRNTSLLCGVSMAWAGAQLNFGSLSIGPLGKVDLNSASIPLVLSILLVYLMSRCTIEYMMQENEVRRWKLAQLDYKLTFLIFRFSLLVLVFSLFSRSLEMVFLLLLSVFAVFASFFAVLLSLFFAIVFVRSFVSGKRGVQFSASGVVDSFFWSALIVSALYIILFIISAFSSFSPFLIFIENDVSNVDLAVVSAVCIFMMLTFLFESRFLNVIFAIEPKIVVRRYKDNEGREIMAFEDNPKHPDFDKHGHKIRSMVRKNNL
ncbi:MAG: hypothetical protein HLX50_13970 [Alteromonadaceae bacterium]|nr:hypothetical protein [Alteromonadaceae bacterium]